MKKQLLIVGIVLAQLISTSAQAVRALRLCDGTLNHSYTDHYSDGSWGQNGYTEYHIDHQWFDYTCYDMNDPSLVVQDNSALPYPVTDGVLVEDTENSTKPGECTWDYGSHDAVCSAWNRYYAFPTHATFDSTTCVVGPRPLLGTNNLNPTFAQMQAACPNLSGFASGSWQNAVTSCNSYYRRDPGQTCSSTSTVVNADGSVSTTSEDYSSAQVAGCGFCVNPVVEDSCYAQPMSAATASSLGLNPAIAEDDACQGLADSGEVCSLVSSTTIEVEGGIERARREQYSCTKTVTRCLKYQRDNTCMESDLTFGLQPPQVAQQNLQSLAQANVATAQIQAAGQSLQKTPVDRSSVEEGWLAQHGVPKLFGGELEGCEKPANSFFGIVMNNCCKTDLSRDSSKPANVCTLGEIKLATAKRKRQTVYLGDQCVQDITIQPFRRKICIKKRETYCKFEDILPRLIQEQGRAQLYGLYIKSLSGASATVVPSSWTLYSANNNYNWTQLTDVGDRRLYAYQWPAYCTDVDSAFNFLTANPMAPPCPDVLGLWFAICESGNCSTKALPASPMDGETNGWQFRFVNPFVGKNHVLGASVLAEGSCVPSGNNANCNFTAKMYPKGSGGKMFVSHSLSFSLLQEDLSKQEGMVKTDTNAAMSAGMILAGDVVIIAKKPALVDKFAFPSQVTIEYSVDNGATFIPQLISTTNASSVPLGSTGLTIDGSCDAYSLYCNYRIVSEQTICPPGVYGSSCVPQKPWMPTGEPSNGDCSGFTPAQFSLLDISEMDLSEWTQTLQSQLGTQNESGDKATATANASDIKTMMMTGAGTFQLGSSPQTQGIKLAPTEEWGPFQATMRVSANYPEWYEKPSENTNPVSMVQVDWGDCTPIETLTLQAATIGSSTGSSFTGAHGYLAPKDYTSCGGGEHDMTHEVIVSITASDGLHQHKLPLRNVWDNYRGTTGNAAPQRDYPQQRKPVVGNPVTGGDNMFQTPGPNQFLP